MNIQFISTLFPALSNFMPYKDSDFYIGKNWKNIWKIKKITERNLNIINSAVYTIYHASEVNEIHAFL